MLWKGLLLAIFLVLALIGVNAGLTYGIVDANQDTEVVGRSMMVRNVEGEAEVPVATSNNEVTVTIAAIPFLPPSAVSHTKHVAFTSEDGQTHYYKTIQSVVVTPEKSVRLKTTDGDVIEWAIGDGKELAITLEEGTEWKLCIYCTECTAANVYATPEILGGLENFETATGMEARRHLSGGSMPGDGGRVLALPDSGEVPLLDPAHPGRYPGHPGRLVQVGRYLLCIS